MTEKETNSWFNTSHQILLIKFDLYVWFKTKFSFLIILLFNTTYVPCIWIYCIHLYSYAFRKFVASFFGEKMSPTILNFNVALRTPCFLWMRYIKCPFPIGWDIQTSDYAIDFSIETKQFKNLKSHLCCVMLSNWAARASANLTQITSFFSEKRKANEILCIHFLIYPLSP